MHKYINTRIYMTIRTCTCKYDSLKNWNDCCRRDIWKTMKPTKTKPFSYFQSTFENLYINYHWKTENGTKYEKKKIIQNNKRISSSY